MKKILSNVKVSTPGRICLFGEHQDYLFLPVIPAAISLRVSIEGNKRSDKTIRIALPDIRSEVEFSLEGRLEYVLERDYFRSVLNVMRRNGFTFSHGFDCVVSGNIPIRAGTSSSSALVVSWVNFLALMSDQQAQLKPEEIANYAYSAEVLEFGEPGGMMDQYSTAYGGVLFLRFHPNISINQLHVLPGTFVLGDSNQPKDTKAILSNVKNRVMAIAKRLSDEFSEFSLYNISRQGLNKYGQILSREEMILLDGTIRNRDITFEAYDLFRARQFDDRKFSDLLNEHQSILRDVLKISTQKIDGMLAAALEAGAYGGKINGSGGGGCMFVYAPNNPEMVADAIERAGGKAFIIKIAPGTSIED